MLSFTTADQFAGQPATLAGAIAVLIVVALAASWLPARRTELVHQH